MSRALTLLSASLVVPLGAAWPALGQQPREQAGFPRSPEYGEVAPGLLGVRRFATDALPTAILEMHDLILGPGKAASAVPTAGPTIVELKSGEVETTIAGQTAKRRPGEFWVVLPGQAYALRSLGGPAVLHTLVFTRR